MNGGVVSIKGFIVSVFILLALLFCSRQAKGDYLQVYSPEYDAATHTGYSDVEFVSVNNSGTAAFNATYYSNNSSVGFYALKMDASGNTSVIHNPWGSISNPGGVDSGLKVFDINNSGTVLINGGGQQGTMDASGNVSVLSFPEVYQYHYQPFDVSDTGQVLGYGGVVDTTIVVRPVRWDMSGNLTALGDIGPSSAGRLTRGTFIAASDSGVATGYITGAAGYQSQTPVRWDASGTTATVLRGDSPGPMDVNNIGIVAGTIERLVGGHYTTLAVRWDANGDPTELGVLGTDGRYSNTWQAVEAINNAGTVVGVSDKYADGEYVGHNAVRWDASGTLTELENPWIQLRSEYTYAMDISDNEITVGEYHYFDQVAGGVDRAAMWDAEGHALDLNDLIDPASGWTLTLADYISPNGQWIAGHGKFDPDGSGPLQAYSRDWVMQVPEPAALSLLALGGLAMLRRRISGSI